jgi:hypothetical protein
MIRGVALNGRGFQPRRKAQPLNAALAAEVIFFESRLVPQGLKPDHFWFVYGMAKAMPFQSPPIQIPLQTLPISPHA